MCSYHMSLSVRPAGELRAFASRHPSGVAAVVMEAPPAMRSIVDVYVHIYIYIYIYTSYIYIYIYVYGCIQEVLFVSWRPRGGPELRTQDVCIRWPDQHLDPKPFARLAIHPLFHTFSGHPGTIVVGPASRRSKLGGGSIGGNKQYVLKLQGFLANKVPPL